MKLTPRLVSSLAVAALAAVGLSACTASTPTPVASSPSATSVAPSSPATASAGLSFADGNTLSADVKGAPTFLDGFASPTSGWTATADSDAKSGRYVYSSSDKLCTVTLSQKIADGKSFAVVKGDDRTSSGNALVWYFSSNPTLAAQVKTAMVDATLPYGIGWETGDPGTDFRGISAETTNGAAFATYARVFATPGVALIAEITCTTATGFAQHAQNALLDSGVVVLSR